MDFLISCPTCSCNTNKTSNICRHLKTVHHLTEDAVNEFKERIVSNKALETHGSGAFSWGYCNHIVATKNGLDSHIRRKHPKPLINPADFSLSTSPPIQAPPPKKIHLSKTTEPPVLLRQNYVAPEPVPSKSGNMACPECEATYTTREYLAIHFSENHAPESEVQLHRFETAFEFQNWLRTREEDTCSSWTVRNSRNNGGVITTYRSCKHERSYDSEAKELLVGPSKKLTGSNLCPSFLKKKEFTATGTIEVVGYFDHFGHDKYPGHRAFNDEEIEFLLGLIREGFSNAQIIEKCDKNMTKTRS